MSIIVICLYSDSVFFQKPVYFSPLSLQFLYYHLYIYTNIYYFATFWESRGLFRKLHFRCQLLNEETTSMKDQNKYLEIVHEFSWFYIDFHIFLTSSTLHSPIKIRGCSPIPVIFDTCSFCCGRRNSTWTRSNHQESAVIGLRRKMASAMPYWPNWNCCLCSGPPCGCRWIRWRRLVVLRLN